MNISQLNNYRAATPVTKAKFNESFKISKNIELYNVNCEI